MKLITVCMKNFKVLLRSKTSAITIFLGPLLIILIVGLAFNSQGKVALRVGVYAPSYTELTTSFIDAIKENQITVVNTTSAEDCRERIKLSQLHMCIIFPENFVIADNKTNELVFYVDQSRTNFVATIKEIVASKVEFRTTELSYSLTDTILNVVSDTKQKNEQSILVLIKADTEEEKSKAGIDSIKTSLGQMNLQQENVPIEGVQDAVDVLIEDRSTLITKGKSVISAGNSLVTSISNTGCNVSTSSFTASLSQLNTTITTIQNGSSEDMSALTAAIDNVTSAVTTLNERLGTAKTATDNIKQKADEIKADLNQLKNDTGRVKATLESINDNIEGIKVTSAESIVKPITTRVEPVITEGTNLTYMLPYLVVLIIMFISIMLSATMVVMEKKSRAFFRNFTTPTGDITFILATFLTNIILTVVQLVIIMGVAYFFLHIALPHQLLPVVLLIIITTCLFTSIGMGIGYLLNSQEGVTLASLSLGSVMLLLSNIIIPLESMSAAIQKVAQYNIYVIASEMLKKVMLFSVTTKDMYVDFAILFGISLAIFILIVIVQKVTKMHYLLRWHGSRVARAELRLANGHIINSLKELMQELDAMNDAAFALQKPDIYAWVRSGLQNKRIARHIKHVKTRAEFMKTLDKHAKQYLS